MINSISMINSIRPVKQVHCLLHRGIFPQVLYHGLHTDSAHRVMTTNASPSTLSPTKPIISSSLYAESSKHPLSLLPFVVLVRSYLIAALSSSPQLLTSSLHLLSKLSSSRSRFLNIDRNVVLRYILKNTLYAHFCAGENPAEVKDTVSSLKRIGYRGVILAYAKEILVESGEKITPGFDEDESAAVDVATWKQGNLKTVKLAEEGDFVAIKFTGAGNHVVQQLSTGTLPGRMIENAMIEICELAKARGVSLLIDSEQNVVQGGIERWTLHFQTRYNAITNGKSVVYGTYQAYLRSTPAKLAQHLAVAQKQGIVLGIKLVRGAYMGCDPRSLFWGSKAATDHTYDGIAQALIRKEYNDVLAPAPTGEPPHPFPQINYILATHNRASIHKALDESRKNERQRADHSHPGAIVFGQLMGMADEVSSELVLLANTAAASKSPETHQDGVRTYKYLPWGSVGECLAYLVRRAEENRDAVGRARDGRVALGREVWRRVVRGVEGRG